MPTAAEIVRELTAIANRWIALAIVWHVAILALFGALASGWRPDRRTAGLMLAALTASVAVVAAFAGSLFNASIFAVITGALVFLAVRTSPPPPDQGRPRWAAIVGSMLVGFGFVYPHFLDRSAAMYLVAAPVGVVPCPTLAVVVGFTLIARDLQTRARCWTLVTAAAFYALFGAFRLGVLLDIGLLAGAGALAVLASRRRHADRW